MITASTTATSTIFANVTFPTFLMIQAVQFGRDVSYHARAIRREPSLAVLLPFLPPTSPPGQDGGL